MVPNGPATVGLVRFAGSGDDGNESGSMGVLAGSALGYRVPNRGLQRHHQTMADRLRRYGAVAQGRSHRWSGVRRRGNCLPVVGRVFSAAVAGLPYSADGVC